MSTAPKNASSRCSLCCASRQIRTFTFRRCSLPGSRFGFWSSRFEESISLWASPVIMQEIIEVLRGKFGRSEADVEEIMLHLAHVAQIVVPIERVYAVEDDPDDNAILECAIASHSDFIVSGDRHLLRLGEHRGIPIVRVVDFLGRIPSVTATE